MKITTFNEHGNVLEEHDYGNLAPKCFLEFNPSQPIFSLEEDDLNIILSKSMSPEKTNLVDQFKSAFEIDFSLFSKSTYNKYRNIEQTYSSLMKDSIIKSVDKELSVLLKDYSIKYKSSKLSPCASEILLSEKWIDVLLYHAFNSGIRNRRAKDPDSALLKSFLNLLSRYYYALKRQFEIGNLGVKTEVQLTILRPYINLYKSLYGRPIGLDNRFYERLLFSLHVSNYKNKCVHYNLIALIEQLAGATTNEMCHFKIKDSKESDGNKEYTFVLSNYAHKERNELLITDLEIDSFRIRHSEDNEALKEVSNLLYDIYNEHLKANKEKFEKEVQSDYEDYCDANGTTDWRKYKLYYKDRIRQRALAKKGTDPEECYYNILFSYDTSDGLLSIRDKDIIADLFELLILNNDKDQYPLFKGIICLNYIKQQIENEEQGTIGDEVSNAVTKAIRYIMPIYDGRHVNKDYKESIKTIIDGFMNLEDTRDNITDIIPNTFDGGFNLELVYSFIGLLKSRGIFKAKRSGRKLNSVFSGKESELRGYIDKWKDSKILNGDYLKAVEALVDKYVDEKK